MRSAYFPGPEAEHKLRPRPRCWPLSQKRRSPWYPKSLSQSCLL